MSLGGAFEVGYGGPSSTFGRAADSNVEKAAESRSLCVVQRPSRHWPGCAAWSVACATSSLIQAASLLAEAARICAPICGALVVELIRALGGCCPSLLSLFSARPWGYALAVAAVVSTRRLRTDSALRARTISLDYTALAPLVHGERRSTWSTPASAQSRSPARVSRGGRSGSLALRRAMHAPAASRALERSLGTCPRLTMLRASVRATHALCHLHAGRAGMRDLG